MVKLDMNNSMKDRKILNNLRCYPGICSHLVSPLSGGCEITPTASYLVDGEGTVEEEIQGPPVIFWPELKAMLSKKLSAKNLVDNLRWRVGVDSFEAGEAEDTNMATTFMRNSGTSWIKCGTMNTISSCKSEAAPRTKCHFDQW